MLYNKVFFEDREIENERLELTDKGSLYFFGSNVTFRKCTLVLKVSGRNLLFDQGTRFIDCISPAALVPWQVPGGGQLGQVQVAKNAPDDAALGEVRQHPPPSSAPRAGEDVGREVDGGHADPEHGSR